MIVADSNLIAYLLIPGAKSALAERIITRDRDWAVPLLCRSEVRNILALYMRHEGMTVSQAKSTMERAESLSGAKGSTLCHQTMCWNLSRTTRYLPTTVNLLSWLSS